MKRMLPLLLAFVCASLLRADTVLVLPFFNQTESANLDWIGESIAENVGEALASEGLLTIDREDRLEVFRRLSVRPNAILTRATIIKAGQGLDASKVVWGYYELAPPEGGAGGPAAASRGSLRVNARLLDLRQMRRGPEYVESGALEDLGAIETRLGWQTLQFLAPHTSPSEQEFLSARPPVRVDAMENYVRGLLATNAEQQHRFFTQAARLDERFSQPRYQLGKIYWKKKEYRVAAGWLVGVRRSDSHYLEAQFYLGLSKYYGGDFAGAEQCFRTVAASVPLNEVWNNLGAAQARQARGEAIESFRKALEGDDADPDYHFNIGYARWKAGQFDAAVESFRAALERNPEDAEATTYLGRALKKDGPRPAEAKSGGLERLKTDYEERAYRALKAELEGKRN
ncbi:MAG TPA: tetratricopeptide repeat protein [Bryobacteraceae bacterium]|nr:tetratricopeptide repeat protein [Bryobacteraceae bacterium]